MSTLPAQRRIRILERIAEDGAVNVSELARLLGVSEMSVRRDLYRLEQEGFLRRAYGGAMTHITRVPEPNFNPRSLTRQREKRLIGVATAKEITGSGAVFLGVGTTTEQVARFVEPTAATIVLTNSLPIASVLATRDVEVFMLGGRVRSHELNTNGRVAIDELRHFMLDVAVIGAAGVSARLGVTDLNDEDAAVNRFAIERAGRVIVAADGSKVGRVAMARVVDITSLVTIATDSTAGPDELASLETLGARVILADTPAKSDGQVRRPRARLERSKA